MAAHPGRSAPTAVPFQAIAMPLGGVGLELGRILVHGATGHATQGPGTGAPEEQGQERGAQQRE